MTELQMVETMAELSVEMLGPSSEILWAALKVTMMAVSMVELMGPQMVSMMVEMMDGWKGHKMAD